MYGPVANDLRARVDDWAFAARWRRQELQRSAGSVYVRLRDSVARTSPTAFAALSRVLGRRQPAAPGPLPLYGAVVEIDGIRMRIDPLMSEHNIRKLAEGRHTRHERELLAKTLREDDVVMELGGGIGMVAIACAKRLGSQRVFSYEANPRLEPLIRENYALNGVEPTLAMAMLGAEPGGRTFHLSDRFSRSSTIDSGQSVERVEVPVLPFDEELRKNRPSILVVDIQGGEAELLDRELGSSLDGVRAILLEIHVDMIGMGRTRAVRQRLRQLGFTERWSSSTSFLFERG